VTDDGLLVRVLVPGGTGNDAFARFIADADESVGADTTRFTRSPSCASDAVLAQRSASEAQTVLDRLVAGGTIEPTRRTSRKPFPTYVLTAAALAAMGRAVSDHWRQTDAIDRSVIDHVREYGHVTNQTLRRLFNMDILVARDVLRDLQHAHHRRKTATQDRRWGHLGPPRRSGQGKPRTNGRQPCTELLRPGPSSVASGTRPPGRPSQVSAPPR